MAGYTRQDVSNNIADGNIINASDFDNEYNAIEAAFNASTGHTHDGTAAEGAPITKIGPTQDVVASASALTPKVDNTVDLGSSSFEYKDLYIDGTANIDSLAADVAVVSGTTSSSKFIPTGNVTAGNGMYLPATNTLAWSTNGAEGMRLDASGNVSIGTTGGDFSRTWRMVARNDQDAVTEIGVINTSTGASAVASIAKIGGTANSFVNWELVENSGTPYDSFLYGSAVDHVRWDFGGSERMRITSTGNLGIGTSSPFNFGVSNVRAGDVRYVLGDTSQAADKRYWDQSSTGGVLYFRSVADNDTNSTSFMTAERGTGVASNWIVSAVTLNTNGAERLRIDASGNVGIGTSSPAASLDVNGGVRAIQGLPTSADLSNVGFSFGPDGDTGLFSPTTGGATSGTLVFYGNAVELARFDSGSFITSVNNTAPTLSTNSTMSFELTSNTSLKIVVRGTDGVTRSVSLTLA